MPFADASFDTVVSHLGLDVMAPLDAVMAEIRRVLAPGGQVAAIVGGGPAADAPRRVPMRFSVLVARPRCPTFVCRGSIGDPRACATKAGVASAVDRFGDVSGSSAT